jgi:hypothetical protein
MDWKPPRIFGQSAWRAPTETTESLSDVFVGSLPAESGKICAAPDPADLAPASAILDRAGVRIMEVESGTTIGIWSDLDGPAVRRALHALGLDGVPARYLDGPGVPERCKLRQVGGEPLPEGVLAEMERHPAEPWKVRDQMSSEMGWCTKGTPWAEWKAANLNRLFRDSGAMGQPGRITAETVRHGERQPGRR